MKGMRVLFFGMLGAFSLPPLQALLEAGFSVVGVVVPTENREWTVRKLAAVTARPEAGSAELSQSAAVAVSTIPLTPKQPNIVHLAWQRHIPVYEVSHLSAPETRQILADLRPDAACVACFNKRIPANVLALPRHGFLNVHPSLLPQFRGPAPLFWTFRAGIQETGVTIHFMDEGLDTGDIAQQAPLTLPDGITGPEADTVTATLGGKLLVNTLNQLINGTLKPAPQLPGGSSHPWPQTSDFRVPVSWSAQRAFNFMRGTAVFGQPYVIELEAGEIVGKTAVSFQSDTQLNQPVQTIDDETWVRFSPGSLQICLE
jgi:methionyl-tRNA formyltransferase